MTTGTLNTKATLYYGPSTTEFIPDISFSAGTQFNVLWQEGSWYYVSVLGGARRNYVPKNLMTVSGAVPTYVPSLLPRRIHTYGLTRLGPTTNYPQNGSLNPDTTVHYLDTKKEGDFALIQIRDQSTGKYKRVWYEHMKVGPYAGPVNYRYISGTYGGVALHIIRTHANNIRLLDQTIGTSDSNRKAMQDSGYFGCNGGWFQMGEEFDILNIAMYNGVNVGDGKNGGRISTMGTGAIGWNGNTSALSNYTNVTSYTGINYSTQANTWVQGGYHLWLGYSGWKNKFTNQQNGESFIKTPACRTAMIANMTTKDIYLVVTKQSVMIESFRSAIQAYLGISDTSQRHSSIQGLLLDGGGSSQMRAKDSSGAIRNIAPDGTSIRPLAQIVVMKNAT